MIRIITARRLRGYDRALALARGAAERAQTAAGQLRGDYQDTHAELRTAEWALECTGADLVETRQERDEARADLAVYRDRVESLTAALERLVRAAAHPVTGHTFAAGLALGLLQDEIARVKSSGTPDQVAAVMLLDLLLTSPDTTGSTDGTTKEIG